MLDMLILAEADRFVGISVSTFSWYLRELRCLAVSGLLFLTEPAELLTCSLGSLLCVPRSVVICPPSRTHVVWQCIKMVFVWLGIPIDARMPPAQ